jgi:N-acyl-D-amino-acid deacylase
MRKPILFLAGLLLVAGLAGAQQEFDVLIRNGRIVDGSGNPWYSADVGIRAGRIAAIGRLQPAAAKRVLDAAGRIVAPGFIDVHTHGEEALRRMPEATNFLRDGVTAIVLGNCGGSVTDLAEYFAALRASGIALNAAMLIGHNSVRRAVMGTEPRDPTPEELARMEQLVERAMREGAVGFSTGLVYIPGAYAKTDEVLALARVAARYSGVYASHIRDEGSRLFEAIEEALHIGRAAGMPVQISHFKVAHRELWGQSTRSIQRVLAARAAGLDVTVDQYPYAASSTNLGVLLPPWALAGGPEAIRQRLADPPTRRRIAAEMVEHIRNRNGFSRLDYARVARCEWDRSLEGKSIAQINRERGRTATLANEIATVLELMEKGGASMVYHSMSETDVERILQFPYAMVASDGRVVEFGEGVPHPRSYGTNARVLARYVREKGLLRLEEAIRKMTSLPAQRFGFTDRGLIRPGLWADLVIFDPDRIADRATFERPHAYSEGFDYVLVNGQVVIESDRHTGARPGQVLTGPGARPETGYVRLADPRFQRR